MTIKVSQCFEERVRIWATKCFNSSLILTQIWIEYSVTVPRGPSPVKTSSLAALDESRPPVTPVSTMHPVSKTRSVARRNLARLPRNFKRKDRDRRKPRQFLRTRGQPAGAVACLKSRTNLVRLTTTMLMGKAELAQVRKTKKCVEDTLRREDLNG